MHGRAVTRFAVMAFAAMLAVGTSACRSTTGHDDEEPNIAVVHIVANPTEAFSSTVTINLASGGQSAPLNLRLNQANTIIVRFLDPSGLDDDVVAEHHDDYELRFQNLGGMTFTHGSGFPLRGTLTPNAVGQTTIRLILFNLDHGHAEVQRDVLVNVVAG
jgi:hypothetical protein